MNRETENFEQLRQLLVLKRYETPPPGYFEGFSTEVINRIRAEQRLAGVTLRERLTWEAPWFERLISIFEGRPALAGIFGAAVCGLLLTALVYSEANQTGMHPGAQTGSISLQTPATPEMPSTAGLPMGMMAGNGLGAPAAPSSGFVPGPTPAESLFNSVNSGVGVQRANFQFPQTSQ